MNWNIFKRLRTVETDHSNTDIPLEALLKRVYAADARIEDLTRSIAGLNARVETQAGILGVTLGDIARDRNDLLKRLSLLEKNLNSPLTDAEKLAKLKAYRKAYYCKNKAAKAALKDPK